MQKKLIVWLGALLTGTLLGALGLSVLDVQMAFVATVYTRLFQLLAVPTIFLAVVTTLASFGRQAGAGRLFRHTLRYTLLTTFAAAAIGLLFFLLIAPGPLPAGLAVKENATATAAASLSYYEHILTVVPNNVVRPFLEGNVLSLLMLAFAVGIGLSRMPESEPKRILMQGLQGLQELLFLLIRALIWTLPLGIVAFSAQLSAQASAGVAVASLGRYVAVVLSGNATQFFVVLPLFLLARGLNPLRTLGRMMPAVLMALFTKSSAATLPVTMETAERRLGVTPRVARFVLPICTTINMNGCAAFILVTSLFVMQNGGVQLTATTMLLWLFISVFAAVGNAGVPMGCYFLTLSLVADVPGASAVMGVILPLYTLIDMLETAENVWSDSCVCAMTQHDLAQEEALCPA